MSGQKYIPSFHEAAMKCTLHDLVDEFSTIPGYHDSWLPQIHRHLLMVFYLVIR